MVIIINPPQFLIDDQEFLQNYEWEEYMIDDEVENASPLRKTERWGDILDPIADDQEEYLRIYFQNVRGLCKRGIDWRQDLGKDFDELTQTGADIYLFQETHLNAQHKKAVRLVHETAKSTWRTDHNQNARVALESCDGDDMSFRKFGGLISIVTGDIVGRVHQVVWDPFGRWNGFYLQGRDQRKILVLNV